MIKLHEHALDDILQSELSTHSNDVAFDIFWQQKSDWYEKPNQRYGGWSGVTQFSLSNDRILFVKRQENYLCFMRRFFFLYQKVPTFHREYLNMQRLNNLNIGCPEVAYYCSICRGKIWCAVLVTHQLAGFSDLACWFREHGQHHELRLSLVIALAKVVAQLHDHKLKHRRLSDRHIFVRSVPKNGIFYMGEDIAFIDLEHMKKGFFEPPLDNRDIRKLIGNRSLWDINERKLLLCNYRQERIRLKKQRINTIINRFSKAQ